MKRLLLPTGLATAPVHVIVGSTSDLPVAERVLTAFRERGMTLPLHVLSCHRSPEAVRTFAQEFQGKAVVCIGGKAFALPGVLDSWFLRFGKKVGVWGIPTGSTFYQIGVAVSAMWYLPSPCQVLWQHDNSAACISKAVEEVVAYITGQAIPKGLSDEEWRARVQAHRKYRPIIGWEPEKGG